MDFVNESWRAEQNLALLYEAKLKLQETLALLDSVGLMIAANYVSTGIDFIDSEIEKLTAP